MNYYGQNMAMRLPVMGHIKNDSGRTEKMEEWCVCGSLCTFADVLVRKASFTDLNLGDVLTFYNAGAYSVTDAPGLFLSRNMPNIYRFSENRGFELIRKGPKSFEINCGNDE